jgi:biopolymer transport protein ExbD
MKIRRPRRRQPLVPLTSFGDIAFQLIIFFVLASVFMKESHIRSRPPPSPDIDLLEPALVSVVLDEDGRLWVQGEECAFDALEPVVSSLLGERKDRRVYLKMDRARPYREFSRVLAALAQSEAELVLIGEKAGSAQ